MKRLAPLFFVLLALPAALLAQPLSGTLLDAGTREPVGFAFIVVLESGEVAESAEDGSFTFDPAPEPPFTLRVAVDGYVFADRLYEALPEGSLELLATRTIVQMETIEAVAERPVLATTKAVEQAAIRDTATGGNPFAIVDRSPDTVSVDMPALDNDIVAVKGEIAAALGLPILSMVSTFSFRGLPYYSNAFFLNDLIPLAFQNYGLTLNMLGSVFPGDVLSGIDMYGAGRNPALGPGAGLITSAITNGEPADGKLADQSETIVSASLLAAGIVHRTSLADGKAGLVVSLRKSVYELTWIPLITALNRTYKWFEFLGTGDSIDLGIKILPGNVDALVSFWMEPAPGQRLSLDAFTATGYTDIVYQTYSRLFGFIDFERLDLSSESGLDAAWRFDPREDLRVELSAYELLAWNMNLQRMGLMGGEESRSTFHYPLNEAGGGLSLAGAPWQGTAISAGLSGRWLYGWYDRSSYTDPIVGFEYKDISVEEQALNEGELSAWAEASIALGRFELVPSIRLDWLSMTGVLYPSPMLQAFWYPAAGHSAHAGGGLRHDRIDYIVRHLFASNRDLSIIDSTDSEGVTTPVETIDERYVQNGLARLFTGEADYAFEKPDFSFRAVVYGAYMDKLSGFNLDTYYSSSSFYNPESDTDIDTPGLKASDALWTAGGNLDFGFGDETASLDLLYNLQASRYHADLKGDKTYEWIIPKNDITHQFKFFGHLEPGEHWELGATLKALLGIPATPNKVTEIIKSVDGTYPDYILYEEVEGKRYQLRDYMPRFNLDFKIAYRWGKTTTSWELFLDVANLISFPHYTQPALRVVGAVEQSALDREYDWSPVRIEGLPSMRIDAGLKIRF